MDQLSIITLAAAGALFDGESPSPAQVYHYSGSVPFLGLPALSINKVGNVYDVTDNFTSTSDFTDGGGKSYFAGTNVAIANTGTEDSPILKYDCLTGDLSGILQDISEIKGVIPSGATTSNKLATASDVSGKADKVSSATNGDLAALDASGNLTDSGSKVADFIISGGFSGESITLTDVADARLQGLKIYGSSELSQGSIVSVGENGLTVTCGNTSVALSSELPLRGVPVTAGRDHNYTDENDQDWTGDIYDITGKKIAYTALIDLGDLTWEKRTGSGVKYFAATPELAIKQLPGTQNQIVYDLICTDGYTSDTGRNIYYGENDKTISLGGGTIAVYNSAYASETAETFKAAVAGVKLLYIIETPVEDNVSAKDKAALIGLRTAPGSMSITNTESAYMEAAYLKNSDSGDAISRVVDLLQGTDIKVFTYTGTGTVNHSITFPEVPKMVLAMFGQHTYSSNTWSVSSRPFVWGVRPVFVDWCAVGGTSNDNQMMPATYNGREISFSGMAELDPGVALNAEGETYTVYYI